jgi:transcriptional regulator with XRE-family HTH domain
MYKEVNMEFRLQKLRKERNISQLKLALDLNMNQNTISRYENMQREADYETLIKLADYFDVSIDYLLGRTEIRSMRKGEENAEMS